MNSIIKEAMEELARHWHREVELPPNATPRQVVIYYTDGDKFNVASFQLAKSGLINHMCKKCWRQIGYMSLEQSQQQPECEKCEMEKEFKHKGTKGEGI